jgi:allophanate hydrolase
MNRASSPLDLESLRRAYDDAALTPTALVSELLPRMEASESDGVWITRRSADALLEQARTLEERRRTGAQLPLYGVPFAVKDNIDVANVPTTAAAPELGYTPAEDATVVARLTAAGAICLGKTNMDQLATGLVGVRSPYGIPRNPFDARYIVGGSSSGSAAAVARGLASFALGTDTAGSGRVPAAFTNVVGLKPSRGLLSTTGVMPACRSLDCVSIFALTCEEAAAIADVTRGYDVDDPWSRPEADRVRWAGAAAPSRVRLGVLADADLEALEDHETARLYQAAVAGARAQGAVVESIDLAPFHEAGALLYDGPCLAERLSRFEDRLSSHTEAFLPVIRQILTGGHRFSGTDVYRGLERLRELQRRVRLGWRALDALLLPTTPTIYTVDAVAADPVRLNGRLGQFTSFVNLLDLSAVAVPAGFRRDGLPAGVSLVGPRDGDPLLAAIGARLHRRLAATAGATGRALPGAPAAPAPDADVMRLAVVGAHLAGEPLNWQLVELGARLVRACRTAPAYRLYALPGTTPPKPGLVRVRDSGAAIEIEVWELPRAAFGTFFGRVVAPLCIGSVETDDGDKVAGFLCESHAVAGAKDITALGGWRRFVHR